MKKVICLIAIGFMLVSTCQAKTIEWKDAEALDALSEKIMVITEEKIETNIRNVSLTQLMYERDQFQARIDHLEMLRDAKDTEIFEVLAQLGIVKVDGVYTEKKVVISK